MPLLSGTHLDCYEILGPLGRGGMGEVYQARDSKLGRDVAIKVLPNHLSFDPERLGRFEREARLLAALNHTNVAAIYGLEEEKGVRFLVLELVPGNTLAQILRDGPLPLDEALKVGRQIAEALEAAHEKGIVHRDLKPSNIKLTPEGKAKVLDFGLAKDMGIVAPSGSGSLEVTRTYQEQTREDLLLGTVPYMSPEQARGKPVDKRFDIWAFGCVMFELISGKRAFFGETPSDTIAAILKSEPDWSALPDQTPLRIQRLIRRCLQKDLTQRLRDIGDARLEIEDVLANPDEPAGQTSRPQRIGRTIWLASLAVILAVVSLIHVALRPKVEPTEKAVEWTGERMLGEVIPTMAARGSPDGQTLCIQLLIRGMSQLAVMKPGTGRWLVITQDRTRGIIGHQTWSRDGTTIYFDRYIDSPSGIYGVSVLGGEERLVLEDAGAPEVLPDGNMLVMKVAERGFQYFRFSPSTGRLDPVGPRLQGGPPPWPMRVFPDGKQALFFGALEDDKDPNPEWRLYSIDLTSGTWRPLHPDLRFGASPPLGGLSVSADGKFAIVSTRSGDLFHVSSVARDGTGPIRTLMTLSMTPTYLDVASDGSVYACLSERPVEMLRFPSTGGNPEHITNPSNLEIKEARWTPLELSDGSVLLPSIVSGRSQLLVVRTGKDSRPLVDIREDTGLPAARLGNNVIAFVVGRPTEQTIAIASEDGRIQRRLNGVKAEDIHSLTASPDGQTLYYVASGTIWAIPATDGEPKKIDAGDAVAIEPGGDALVIQRNLHDGVRFIRFPLSGNETAQEISIRGDLRPARTPIVGNAVGRDGRIVVTVPSRDSWFWGPALLDPKTGTLEKIPVNYEGDIVPTTWGSGDYLLGMGLHVKVELWRFRPREIAAVTK